MEIVQDALAPLAAFLAFMVPFFLYETVIKDELPKRRREHAEKMMLEHLTMAKGFSAWDLSEFKGCQEMSLYRDFMQNLHHRKAFEWRNKLKALAQA